MAEDDAHQEQDAYSIEVIAALDDMQLVTPESLAATWPHEYGKGATSQALPESGQTGLRTPTPSPVPGGITVTETGVVNLSQSHLPLPDLLQALKDAEPFTRLDLSHNGVVGKAALIQIMTEHRLDWLNIDGCGISKEDIRELLEFHAQLLRGVEAIIHPEFLSLENYEGSDSGMPCAFHFNYLVSREKMGCISLPFFSIDQVVQSLIDIAKSHYNFKPYSIQPPWTEDIQGLFGYIARSEDQPWADRVVQMIPPRSEKVMKSVEGYTCVFIMHRCSYSEELWDTLLKDSRYHYGIILPGDASKFVDIATFHRHLEDSGWPKPRNQRAVEKVTSLFSDGISLLVEDYDKIMDHIPKWS